MKINRRQFLSLSVLIFAPYFKVKAQPSSFETLLYGIKNPFQISISKERHNLDDWISKLPVTLNVSELSEYVLTLIKSDYIENRVDLIDGVILSNTEIMLFFAKESYA